MQLVKVASVTYNPHSFCCGPRLAADSRSLGGVAAREWRSLLAAPLRRIGGRCGVRGWCCLRSGPWVTRGLLPKPAVRRRWCAAALGGLAALRRGSEWGQLELQSPTCAAHNQNVLRSARRGSTMPRHTKTVYCKVQAHVPAPPSPIISLIYL